MLLIIAYDVKTSAPGGPGRLRRVSQACQDFGQRVQNSVFECQLNPDQWVALRQRLLELVKLEEDSLRVYHLGSNWEGRIEHYGAKPSIDLDGTLVV